VELVFATANQHKAQEIRNALSSGYLIQTLPELNFPHDIQETGNTLQENAFLKAKAVYDFYGKPAFADDTGLEVAALNGEPGVFSARYAGENATYKQNCDLLLQNLQTRRDRNASFKTVICFIDKEGATHFFTGEVLGTITNEFRGTGGFGYDPVFLPTGSEITFAEMNLEQKNSMSHRAKALAAFINFLENS
jgi:XTP/dITP diphosphohydrolase